MVNERRSKILPDPGRIEPGLGGNWRCLAGVKCLLGLLGAPSPYYSRDAAGRADEPAKLQVGLGADCASTVHQ